MAVTIMSWNVQWGRGADCRVDWGRIVAEIEAVAPDVVVLQEVAQHYPELEDNDDTDQVALLAKRLPAYHGCYAPGIDEPGADGRRRRFGNWIGSRWPVVAWQAVPLPAPPATSPKWIPRTVCVVTVAIAGALLRVLGTHLEYYCPRQRRAQVEALRELAQPEPAVLVGDLNFPPQSPEYRLLAQGGVWRDAWPLVHGTEPHADTVGLHGAPWPDHPYCCDYVWVTPSLAPAVRDVTVRQETAASDHQPVVVNLDWPRETATEERAR